MIVCIFAFLYIRRANTKFAIQLQQQLLQPMLNHGQEVIQIADDEAKIQRVLNPGVSSSKFPFLHSILQRKYESKIKLDPPKISESTQVHLLPLKKEQQAPQISNLVRVDTTANVPKQVSQEKSSSIVEFNPPEQHKQGKGQKMDIQEAIQVDEKKYKKQQNNSGEVCNDDEKEEFTQQRRTTNRSKRIPLPDILTVEVCLDPIRHTADGPSPCFSQDESPLNQSLGKQNNLLVVQEYKAITPVHTVEDIKPYALAQVISADQLRQNKLNLIEKYLSMEKSLASNTPPELPDEHLASETQNLQNKQAQLQCIKPISVLIDQEKVCEKNIHFQQNKEIENIVQIPVNITETKVQIVQKQQLYQNQEAIFSQKEIIANNSVSNRDQMVNVQSRHKQIIDLVEITQQNSINPSLQFCNHNNNPEQKTKKPDFTEEELDSIKKKIVQFLPDLEQSISSLCGEELLQIYSKVKYQLSQPLPENHEVEAHQTKEVPLAHDDLSKQNRNTLIQQFHQPLEDISEAHPFYTLRDLGEEDLRNEMVKHFPEAKESIMGMNESQLRDLLNEALAQIQKQTNKGENLAAISHKDNLSLNNNTSIMRTNDHEPSIQEKRAYLSELAPKMQKQIEEINQSYIEQLYKQAKNKKTSKYVQISSEVQHSIITKMCLQKLPSLSAEIEKMNKQQIAKIYGSLKAKLNILPRQTSIKPNPQISKQIHNKVNPQTPKLKPQDSPKELQPSLKRNYQTMISTNPKISNSDGKKKKSQYRAKLLKKFPALKENIMKLDDNQIQKIFKDCLDPHYTKKMQKIDDPKPIIALPDKKFVPESVISQKQLPVGHHEQSGNHTQSYSNKNQSRVIQLQNDEARKKSRTIVLIHTEDIDQEQLEKRQKTKRIGQFPEKKWNCQCLNTVTVTDLIRKLTELIDKKTE